MNFEKNKVTLMPVQTEEGWKYVSGAQVDDFLIAGFGYKGKVFYTKTKDCIADISNVFDPEEFAATMAACQLGLKILPPNDESLQEFRDKWGVEPPTYKLDADSPEAKEFKKKLGI